MNYPKDVRHFIEDLVNDYAKYDRLDQTYRVSLKDIPDFLRYEFAVKLMSLDESWASEATGPDNPAYDKHMLPALMRYLTKTTDRDEEIEFCKEWRDGVSSYFDNQLEELLNNACTSKLCDEMSDAGFRPRQHKDNGELYWSRY